MAFPVEFTLRNNWLCFRLDPNPDGGKPKKTPVNARTGRNGSSTNPDTWCDFETANEACQRYGYAGLGFAITPETGLVGIDVDHCYNPETGEFSETAKAILERQPTYAEFSPSGDGIHLWFLGKKPEGATKNTDTGVEMYDRDRYLTMTGKLLTESPDHVAEAEAGVLEWIHETYVAKKSKRKTRKKKAKQAGEKLTDEEIIEKATSAGNGELFADLMAGKWQDHYPSQSEADMALVMKLAFWSGKDRDQMDRMFRASGLFREKWDKRHHADGATYGEETLERAIEMTDTVYSARTDSPVFEYEGRYFRAKGDSMYPITNFILQPGEMIVADGDVQMTCDFVTTRGDTYNMTFMTTDLANQQRFKNLLSSKTIALGWFGSEGDLELFKTFIAALNWTVKIGVKALGIYEFEGRNVFVSCDGSIDAAAEPVDGIVQLEKFQSIQTAILHTDPLKPEGLKSLGTWLLGYNEAAKTVTILAWSSGCFLKPLLKMEGIKYPHLFLIGEAGSGKSTTLERVILPIFSTDRVTASTQVTQFTLMKESASSNMVPMALDEFKPSKMDKQKLNALYNHLRDTYDGHDGVRGRADQTTIIYHLVAPLVLAGEESADEAAIRERTNELLFSKKDLKQPEHRLCFNRLSMNKELLGDLGRTLLTTALSTTPKEAAAWYEEALGKVQSSLPSRVISNIACCYAGLKLLEKLCAGFRLHWDDVFPIHLDACLKYLEYSTNEYLLDGGYNNKSVVEQTFEVMSRMKLTPNTDYAFSDDGGTMYIRLAQIYDQYTRYRREYAVMGEVLPYSQFRKQLMHSDLLIQGNMQRKFNGVNSRCFAIDYALLKERCEVSEFELPDEAVPLT